MQISAHLAFSSSVQKDDSHWGPSPDCMAGLVKPQSPVVPQSPESDMQCVVEHYHATESLLVSAVLYVLFVLQFELLQQTAVWWHVHSSTMFLKLNKQYSSHVSEHGRHHFACWGHNFELGRSQRFFVFPLPWSLLCLQLIVMNPGLITLYNPLQHRLPFRLVELQVVKRYHLHGLLFRLQLFWNPSSKHLPKLDMIADDSVHWNSWNTGMLNNVWNWHALVRPYESINCGNHGIGCHNNMPARSLMLFLLQANFVHHTCIAGLIKHLSPYTGRISEWSPFAHKKRITARCSLRDDFNGNDAIFNVYKWRHSDVIVIKLTAGTQN